MKHQNASGRKRVLVIGSGGREHALIWKFAQSPLVSQIYAVPGNVGIAGEPKVTPILCPADHRSVVEVAKQRSVDLVVIGPEAPLIDGIADVLEDAGILVFGPRKRGARLEGSKSFAKDLMAQYGIATAPYRYFDDLGSAKTHIQEQPLPVVVKTDGLAAGKGTLVAETHAEAIAFAEAKLASHRRIIVEEFLGGEEATFTCLVSGGRFVPWPTAQDHKRLLESDCGPMTGGMGAISPAAAVDEDLQVRIMAEVIIPLLRSLEVEMIPYTGFLYVGLMIVDGKPYVLEFNCRLGDPEAQPLLMRLQDDLFPILYGAARGKFYPTRWDPRPAVCVVLAAHGYPDNPRRGDVIIGLETVQNSEGIKVFHAGTAFQNRKTVTAGGRVLGVTAMGVTVREARERAYQAVEKIHFDGMHYRRDIGHRALEREMR
ncbi:MAG: phosphoribosylamine--glycine ligase [Candidatus Sungbacteria bacterium]|uniref:Phosphoribosylamine--glycine ligase n=1 Tax=Candidatus Sungiibacteriota bacterium TaxID=2750080 RepID=A0A932YX17_9BACT|nr:phosphoribosylamine--glycine ligase [Candidatus Sungbacteria bacterium]